MQSKKVKIFKITVFIVFLLIMLFLTIRLVPLFKSISTEQGRIEFKQEIESLGIEGIFIIIGLILPRRTSRGTSRNVIWSNWRFNCNLFRCIFK